MFHIGGIPGWRNDFFPKNRSRQKFHRFYFSIFLFLLFLLFLNMLHVLIFRPLKNRRGQNFDSSNSRLDAAWSLLTPPFEILKKYWEMKPVKFFGKRLFGKKYFIRPGNPPKWNIFEKTFFVKMLINVLKYHIKLSLVNFDEKWPCGSKRRVYFENKNSCHTLPPP